MLIIIFAKTCLLLVVTHRIPAFDEQWFTYLKVHLSRQTQNKCKSEI